MNHSKQRDLIYDSLKRRDDHPTAEILYYSVKNEMPSIGMATVYRNLEQLCKMGKIKKISSELGGADRYDANLAPHIHFECVRCHEIFEIYLNDNQSKKIDYEIQRLPENIDAEFRSSNIHLTGYCSKCKKLAKLEI